MSQISFAPRSLATVVAASALLLSACGSGGGTAQVASLSGDATATETTDTTTGPADTQQAMLDFAACMRENGVDMADPTFDADGNPQVFGPGAGAEGGIDPGSTEFQTATEACSSLLDDVQFGGPGGPGGFDRTAIQDTFNSFTACLRDVGLQVDDITLGDGPGAGGPGGTPPTDGTAPADGATGSGGFNGAPGGPPPDGGPGSDGFDPTARLIEQLGLDAEDPAVTAAIETCQPALQDALTPGGDSTTATTETA